MDAIPFDFRRSEQIGEPQLQALRLQHESFIREFAGSLSASLRSEVSGHVVNVEQCSFGNLLETFSAPACMLYFLTEPGEGHVLLEVSQALIGSILDCVLGGDGQAETDPAREITDIEKNMLEDFFRGAGRELERAWSSTPQIRFVLASVETDPQMSKCIGRDEPVISTAMELQLGAKTGTVHLAIPAMLWKQLSPPADRQAAPRKNGAAQEAAVKQRLAAGLKVRVECALTGSRIRLRDLVSLKPGDLVDSGLPCDGQATILLNGIPKLHGELTAENGRQAVMLRSATPLH
ncbi:MAG: hypothetical protein C5B51_07650 [Terriglobia bacterium]|nr:MAG: hypothetical protein C5B51_07650 [Terriglobia bacterium]